MKCVDGIVKNANHGDIAVDQELCKQTGVLVRNADNDDHFPIQSFAFDVQRFESTIAEHEIREGKIDGAVDVPSSKVVLGSKVEDNDSVRFVLQQTDQIVGADARRDLSLDVTKLHAVDVLQKTRFQINLKKLRHSHELPVRQFCTRVSCDKHLSVSFRTFPASR